VLKLDRTRPIDAVVAMALAYWRVSLGASVSVYQTKHGADASSRAVEDFVETTLSADDRVTPIVSDGEVVVHLDAR